MQIAKLKIGHPPDYVMSLDRMTVFHRIHVRITATKLLQNKSIPIANRSLWVAVKLVQDVIRSRISKIVRIEFKYDHKLGSIEITDTDCVVIVEMRLPLDLTPNQETLLRRKFADYFRNFFESLKK